MKQYRSRKSYARTIQATQYLGDNNSRPLPREANIVKTSFLVRWLGGPKWRLVMLGSRDKYIRRWDFVVKLNSGYTVINFDSFVKKYERVPTPNALR